MWRFFTNITFSGTCSSFCHNHFPHLWSQVPFTKFCWLLSKVSQMVTVSTFPESDVASVTPLCLIRASLPALSLLVSLMCFHLWITRFCKVSVEFVAGRQGVDTATTTTTCFAVCAWTVWQTGSDASLSKTLGETQWLVAAQDVRLGLRWRFVGWRASSEIWTLCSYHDLTVVTEVWSVLSGDFYYLTKSL